MKVERIAVHALNSIPQVLRRHARRWCAFNAVGFVGLGIQLGALTLLKEWLGIHYLVATAVAVEAAILHNFVWHEHWTWSDRGRAGVGGSLIRCAKFNLTNGLVSLCGNLLLMRLFVGSLQLHYLPGNLLSIALCSVLNFVLSDRIVFSESRSAPIRPTSHLEKDPLLVKPEAQAPQHPPDTEAGSNLGVEFTGPGKDPHDEGFCNGMEPIVPSGVGEKVNK